MCVDGINGYVCNCTDGYIGPECETGEFVTENDMCGKYNIILKNK